MLKITGIELELISDIGTYLFVEKRIIGGISYIAKRFGKAKNEYKQSYEDKKPSKYVTYLDANHLYDSAVSHYLLYVRFKWLNQREIDKLLSNSIQGKSSNECIFEVDLEYSHKLHELDNGYWLAPENFGISHNMLSNYSSSIANRYDIKIGGANKSVPNLGNKSKFSSL